MNDDFEMCCVCGLPDSAVQLVRLTWTDVSTENVWPLPLIVARIPKSNDRLVCTECIRGIKRLPFSAFAKVTAEDIPD